MRFMLDADSVRFALRGEGRVGDRIREHRPSELCLSAMTVAELRFGAEKRNSKKLRGLISQFVSAIEVVPFDEAAASEFGRVAAALARKGSPIGHFDALIAAHARHLGCTVLTGNLKHFRQVPRLAVESWV